MVHVAPFLHNSGASQSKRLSRLPLLPLGEGWDEGGSLTMGFPHPNPLPLAGEGANVKDVCFDWQLWHNAFFLFLPGMFHAELPPSSKNPEFELIFLQTFR